MSPLVAAPCAEIESRTIELTINILIDRPLIVPDF